jgi:hypothetical protein
MYKVLCGASLQGRISTLLIRLSKEPIELNCSPICIGESSCKSTRRQASDIGFYVYFGPSSETPRNAESTTKDILLQSEIAVTGVLTYFFQQAAADLSPCSRIINLVHLTPRQGAGNRRRSGREAEAFKDPPDCVRHSLDEG